MKPLAKVRIAVERCSLSSTCRGLKHGLHPLLSLVIGNLEDFLILILITAVLFSGGGMANWGWKVVGFGAHMEPSLQRLV